MPVHAVLIAAPLLLAWALRSVFTRRFLAMAGAGVPLLIAGAWWDWPLQPLLIGYNGALVAAAALDFLVSARPSEFRLSRRVDEVLSLGAANSVRVSVAYRGTHATRLMIRDEPPGDFGLAEHEMTADLAPGAEATLVYEVTPPRRGCFAFGHLHVRYCGRLGLILRQARFPAPAEVKVYPDVLAVKKFALLLRSGRLGELGLKAVRLRGTGTNIESVREYSPGDEFRRINWKATARRGRPQCNEYQAEQAQYIFLLLDAGRLMYTRAGDLTRMDHAVNAALMLGYAAAVKGDRVGALVFGREVRGYLAPGKGKGQVAKLAGFLHPFEAEMVESDYARAFSFFAARNHKRSLVCVFTDLIDEDVSGLLLTHLAALSPPHIPLCLALRDPLLDEAARAEIVDTGTVYTKAVAEQVLADRMRARRLLARRGTIVLDVPPAELSAALVDKYLELKERGRI